MLDIKKHLYGLGHISVFFIFQNISFKNIIKPPITMIGISSILVRNIKLPIIAVTGNAINGKNENNKIVEYTSAYYRNDNYKFKFSFNLD